MGPQLVSLLLGFQTVLSNVLNFFYFPLLLVPYLCLLPNLSTSQLIANLLLLSSIATALHSTYGIKLPLVVAPSICYLQGIASLLEVDAFQCPTTSMIPSSGLSGLQAKIMPSHLQTALIITSLLFILLASTGVLSVLYSRLSSTSVSASLIAFSLSNIYHRLELIDFGYPLIAIALVIMTVFVLRQIRFDCALFWTDGNFERTVAEPIKTFPILLTLPLFLLLSCFFPEEDNQGNIINHLKETLNAKDGGIFALPALGTFEWPQISSDLIIVVVCSLIIQIMLTSCCFYAANYFLGQKYLNLNRGYLIEGICNFFSCFSSLPVLIGSNPTAIGIIALTEVKSVWVSMGCSVLLLVLALCPIIISAITRVHLTFYYGWDLFIQAAILASGLFIGKMNDMKNTLRIAISVLMSMVLFKMVHSPSKFSIDNAGLKIGLSLILENCSVTAGLIAVLLQMFSFKRNNQENLEAV